MTDEQRTAWILDMLGKNHDAMNRAETPYSVCAAHIEEQAEKIRELESRLARYTDTRPIDEDGLRELGFKDYGSRDFYRKGLVSVSFVFGRVFSIGVGDRILSHIKTIGQLNLLLDGLGIGGGGDSNTNETGGE